MQGFNWSSIRSIDGSQMQGFEELCAQLARSECPDNSRFIRKGTPDAGVECFAVLPDETEWGWQAKYFTSSPSDGQWTQLDKSVKTALDKHPRLTKYFVCLAIDFSDGRGEGQTTAQDRWDQRVEKWETLASGKGMAVQFVFWGSSELLERLSRPSHVGRLRFWFDGIGFDQQWFQRLLQESTRAAGPRYTPEIHVDLPISEKFEAFGRTEEFANKVKGYARRIRQELQRVRDAKYPDPDPILDPVFLEMNAAIRQVIDQFGALVIESIGATPIKEIMDQIEAAIHASEDLQQLLAERARAHETKRLHSQKSTNRQPYRENPFEKLRDRVYGIISNLTDIFDLLQNDRGVASSKLLILAGKAGTGKTHLLCDITRQRIDKGLPTVLFMGQQFTAMSDPWTQALEHIDLRGFSAEEFVGALEASAQVAGCRALIMVDAVNEGAGRSIWPAHLASFLARVERSAWIGVVLSVRSSYETITIPDAVRQKGIRIEHFGFSEHEYDAARTFFNFFGLDLPSTPLLAPEYRNPLFLKILCQTLAKRGERRIPRGPNGVSAVFNMMLDDINDRLASAIDFDSKEKLVHKALRKFAEALAETEKRWLFRDTAKKTVNELLPNRDFSRSLYHHLVAEGLLIEEGQWISRPADGEVVMIAYDRLSDHLVADYLLIQHLDVDSPEKAFLKGGGLEFLSDPNKDLSSGLLEALCIQVPERTGQELLSLAPRLENHYYIGESFRQSIIWRDIASFTPDTHDVLNRLRRNEEDLHDTIETLLTVATIPNHPLNAEFLDKRLREDAMAERDAWWSISLHYAWGAQTAVDRLVDWAWAIEPGTNIDTETLDLCAIALAWMLTSSHRYLRDRTTKALVNLLSGRFEATKRLVERFADVDDFYVSERIFAVAYGVSMRSHDTVQIGMLAESVYAHVFANEEPPTHILLRDYARGVVERALHLKANIQVDEKLIRPPYESSWPSIPTEEDIANLFPSSSGGSYDGGDLEWSRNRIKNSVMDDDFASYVIGTNSSLSDWLSLRLDEPQWKSPDERLSELVGSFSEEEKAAWNAVNEAEDRIQSLLAHEFLNASKMQKETMDGENSNSSPELDAEEDPEIVQAQKTYDDRWEALGSVLAEDHVRQLTEVLSAQNSRADRTPPRFDLTMIQRYVIWRVFDLGWTTRRFGEFDRFTIGYRGREASKPERMGKKYQWIAYHEIMALVADHFQFRDEQDTLGYIGAWQDGFRDIDPSCTLLKTPGEYAGYAHPPAWWCPVEYKNWGEASDPSGWIRERMELPEPQKLLRVPSPSSGPSWLNLQGHFQWEQPISADQERSNIERRQLWYMCTGYLVRSKDVDAFYNWVAQREWGRNSLPEPATLYEIYLGEFGWSPAFRYFNQPYFGDPGWIPVDESESLRIRVASIEYMRETSGFDCSIEETVVLRLPVNELVEGLDLQWNGEGVDYITQSGQVAAYDPTAHEPGPKALLIREDLLMTFLKRKKLILCWVVLGEKQVLGAGLNLDRFAFLRIQGAYKLTNSGIEGVMKFSEELRSYDTSTPKKDEQLILE